MIRQDCPCKRTKCERHGDCDACNRHHNLNEGKILTACDRTEKERTIREFQKEPMFKN